MKKSNSELKKLVEVALNRYKNQPRSCGYDTPEFYIAQEIGIELDCYVPHNMALIDKPTVKNMMAAAREMYAQF